jgi:hypothetical protein
MVEQIIMSSQSPVTGNIDFGSIIPPVGQSFSEQVGSCIEQLKRFIFPLEQPRFFITQQTFFISARNREEYDMRSAGILDQLSANCGTNLPATSIVAQSPYGREVVLELICTRAEKGKSIRYCNHDTLNYTIVEQEGFRCLHATGLMGKSGDSIQESAEKAFKQAIDILGKEGLTLKNIIRQWNYVENIARVDDPVNTLQNYQIFNDVRAKYYDSESFIHGYPAATGIGTDTGGVIIGFIALSDSDRIRLSPIRNPRQVDAHRYSNLVLKGKSTGITREKCTPRFERGKLVSIGDRHYAYVSGTASILGEKTMYPGDVEMQTKTTIGNIHGLFSRESQNLPGLDMADSGIRFSHLRVYVKYQEDIPVVRKICESMLNFESSLYLQSDICREELLVEIEGICELPAGRYMTGVQS